MKNIIQRFFSEKSEKTQNKMNEINNIFFYQVKSKMRQAAAKRKGYESIDLNKSGSSSYNDEDESEDESISPNSNFQTTTSNQLEIAQHKNKSPNQILEEINFKKNISINQKTDENDEKVNYNFSITSSVNYKYDQENEYENFHLNFSQIEMKLKEKNNIDFKLRMNNPNDDVSSISSISSCSSLSPNSSANSITNKHIPLINISPPPPSKSTRSTAIVSMT